MRHLPLTLGLFLFTAPVLAADTLVLSAAKDNTLWNDPAGALSSGVGPNVYVGTNGMGQARRAVVAFDVAGSIPAGSTVTAVTLSMNCSQVPAGGLGNPLALHRLSADWGEGTSSSAGGNGAASTPGDATWIHTFFNTGFWTSAGGDFAGAASASTVVSAVGPVTWNDPQLIVDVQDMLDNAGGDFGWLLRGDEAQLGNARRLDSRENANAALRPVLTVVFTPPAGVPALPVQGLFVLTAVLFAAGAATLRRRAALSV